MLLDTNGRPVLVREDAAGQALVGASVRAPVAVTDQQAVGAAGAGRGAWREATLVAATTSVREAALRAVSRPAVDRGAPLVCTDERGAVLGTVTLTDLVVALARSTPGG